MSSKRMELTLAENRQCGECTACCTCFGIEALGKPFNCQCEHQDNGCKIYGNHPDECKVYQCLWHNGMFTEQDRPDKLGVVITCYDGHFDFQEYRQGALHDYRVNRIIGELRQRYPDDQILLYPVNVPIGMGKRVVSVMS